MNYHTDEWIMKRLSEHYEEACKVVDKDRIIGIFYVGSGNYGMDFEDSDVDSRCIVIPSFEDICQNNEPMNLTHNFSNEQIVFKDIRFAIKNFKGQGIESLEILPSKYYILNEEYKHYWEKLQGYTENIVRLDSNTFVWALCDTAFNRYKHMFKDTPSQHKEIEEYGWAVKPLCFIARFNSILKKYVNNVPFHECLNIADADKLREIRLYGHTLYNYEQAKEYANDLIKEITDIKEEYNKKPHLNTTVNNKMSGILDDIIKEILSYYFKKSLCDCEVDSNGA